MHRTKNYPSIILSSLFPSPPNPRYYFEDGNEAPYQPRIFSVHPLKGLWLHGSPYPSMGPFLSFRENQNEYDIGMERTAVAKQQTSPLPILSSLRYKYLPQSINDSFVLNHYSHTHLQVSSSKDISCGCETFRVIGLTSPSPSQDQGHSQIGNKCWKSVNLKILISTPGPFVLPLPLGGILLPSGFPLTFCGVNN